MPSNINFVKLKILRNLFINKFLPITASSEIHTNFPSKRIWLYSTIQQKIFAGEKFCGLKFFKSSAVYHVQTFAYLQ